MAKTVLSPKTLALDRQQFMEFLRNSKASEASKERYVRAWNKYHGEEFYEPIAIEIRYRSYEQKEGKYGRNVEMAVARIGMRIRKVDFSARFELLEFVFKHMLKKMHGKYHMLRLHCRANQKEFYISSKIVPIHEMKYSLYDTRMKLLASIYDYVYIEEAIVKTYYPRQR